MKFYKTLKDNEKNDLLQVFNGAKALFNNSNFQTDILFLLPDSIKQQTYHENMIGILKNLVLRHKLSTNDSMATFLTGLNDNLDVPGLKEGDIAKNEKFLTYLNKIVDLADKYPFLKTHVSDAIKLFNDENIMTENDLYQKIDQNIQKYLQANKRKISAQDWVAMSPNTPQYKSKQTIVPMSKILSFYGKMSGSSSSLGSEHGSTHSGSAVSINPDPSIHNEGSNLSNNGTPRP